MKRCSEWQAPRIEHTHTHTQMRVVGCRLVLRICLSSPFFHFSISYDVYLFPYLLRSVLCSVRAFMYHFQCDGETSGSDPPNNETILSNVPVLSKLLNLLSGPIEILRKISSINLSMGKVSLISYQPISMLGVHWRKYLLLTVAWQGTSEIAHPSR